MTRTYLHLTCPVLSPPISLHYRISAKLGSESCEVRRAAAYPTPPLWRCQWTAKYRVCILHFGFLDLRVIFYFISVRKIMLTAKQSHSVTLCNIIAVIIDSYFAQMHA